MQPSTMAAISGEEEGPWRGVEALSGREVEAHHGALEAPPRTIKESRNNTYRGESRDQFYHIPSQLPLFLLGMGQNPSRNLLSTAGRSPDN
jgi:hypothetical protein